MGNSGKTSESVATILVARPTVLIVEDHEDTRDCLVELLRYEGFVPTGVGDAGAAITELLARDPPDVMLLDCLIGTISGLELLDRARAVGIMTPAIVWTGHPTHWRMAADRSDVYRAILKPADFNKLGKILREAIAAFRSRPLASRA